jgi:uncharacterized membrane protein HdeD (DUF308 family)
MEAGARRVETGQLLAPWWTWLVAGLVTLGVGIVVLFEPDNSLKALAVILGIYLLLDSVLAFVHAASPGIEDRALEAIHGVVSLILGLVLVRHPLQSVTAIALFIGIWLLAIGCMRFVIALRAGGRVALHLFVAGIQIIAGIIIVADPSIGYTTLALITGIGLVVQGVAMAALGWSLRHAEADAAAIANAID